jgi:ribonuclease HI
MAKQKYYVIWKGFKTGIFTSWNECKLLVDGFPGARYKSFATRAEAEAAFNQPYENSKGKTTPRNLTPEAFRSFGITNTEAVAVDAACSGSPGPLEYRGVQLLTGKLLFHQGPFMDGTNNVGEFLAIVHALASLTEKRIGAPIYSDSENALLWVKIKRCRTKLKRTSRNAELFTMIERAETWLKENVYSNRLLKWKTGEWGEIPADFGRK